MRRVTSFTPEELEELKRIDAELDAAPLTLEDYEAQEFVDDLLFPEKAKERAKNTESKRRYYERNKEKILAYHNARREADPEKEAARKRAWYQANKDRVIAQQREYRIRTGQLRTPEQREADKLAHAEARKAKAAQKVRTPEQREHQRQYQIAYRAKKKGMTVEEYVAMQEEKRKARAGSPRSATAEYQREYRAKNHERMMAYQREYRERRKAERAAVAVA